MDGVVSTTARNDGDRDLVLLQVNGLIVDTQTVSDVLDARSQDYAHFIPLFGRTRSFGIVDLVSDLETNLVAAACRLCGAVACLESGRWLPQRRQAQEEAVPDRCDLGPPGDSA
jgi:hypothetical protein